MERQRLLKAGQRAINPAVHRLAVSECEKEARRVEASDDQESEQFHVQFADKVGLFDDAAETATQDYWIRKGWLYVTSCVEQFD